MKHNEFVSRILHEETDTFSATTLLVTEAEAELMFQAILQVMADGVNDNILLEVLQQVRSEKQAAKDKEILEEKIEESLATPD